MKKKVLISLLVLIGVLAPFAILILGYMTRDIFVTDNFLNGYQDIYNLLLVVVGCAIPLGCLWIIVELY